MVPIAKTARRVRIHGRVQGVFFRAFTRDCALEAGISGTVRNLPDGSVEAILEGAPGDVARVVDRIRRGPPASRVTEVDVQDEIPNGRFTNFVILR